MLQNTALEILKTGANVFLTGQAGSGKTYVLNKYLEYLKKNKVSVGITASTGIAATHIGGITIHSWSGMGIRDKLTNEDLKNIEKNSNKKDRINGAKVLIVDEISMISKNVLENIELVLQNIRGDYTPFGGLQVIFCGDFFQLPPISKNKSDENGDFCFTSQSWTNLRLKICYLHEQHRQKKGILNDVLNQIRKGNINRELINLLSTKEKEYNLKKNNLKLYTHNVDVDKINKVELDNINSEIKIFKAKTKGNKIALDNLKKSVLAPENLELKIGAKVLFVKNNYGKGYFNGTMGYVVDFEQDMPVVETNDGNIIYVGHEKWVLENNTGKEIASFIQIPLRLAWAITIHKSQGMTLDDAELDLSKTFETGQGYVGLSRLSSWEGLNLKGFNQKALQISPLVLKIDLDFKKLSDREETNFLELDYDYKKNIQNEFIKNICQDTQGRKTDTYQKTEVLIDKGYTLDDIVKERGVGKNTIINHISKIDRNEKNLSRFKPEDNIFLKVKKAVEDIKKRNNKEDFLENGDVKLKVIYEYLQREVSYEDIKLSIFFI